MEDTSGFYRVNDGGLEYAKNGVMSPFYNIDRSLKDVYDYPTPEGWRWFDTEQDARLFFGLPISEETPTE